MRKTSFLGLFVALVLLCSNAMVKAAVVLNADLKAALPSGQYFLPAPPSASHDTLIWQDDSIKYFKYKEAGRKYDQVKQAYWDSIWGKMNEPYDFALYRVAADSVMNAPFISASWTRATAYKYNVTKTRNTTDFPKMNALEQLCEQMKEDNTSGLWRTRPRPYCYFGDWYTGKKYAKDLTNASSYPSGHGYFAGLFGMALMYIDPDNSLAIKKMIDEWAECRLIVGAHWNTDIEAGKKLGAMAFAIAMNYPQFRNAVMDAKNELAAYRAAHCPARIPDDKTNGRNLEQTQAFVTSKLNAWKDSAQTMDLQITRTFYCDGYYNSLSLPFDIDETDWSNTTNNPLAGGTLKKFVSAEVVDNVLNITIETATSVEAGVPYLIKFAQGEDIVNPVFKGIQVTAAVSDFAQADAMNCNGTFVPMELQKGQNSKQLILGTNNSLYWPTQDNEYLRGFRAYFQVNDTPAGVAARKAGSAQLTEKTIPSSDSPIHQLTDSSVYKLIDDGEVIIIRDGVKYGVDGMVR